MPRLQFGTNSCELAAGESVLDGLLRHGVPVPYACRAGGCGSCMLRATEGPVPVRAQAGLKDSWKAQGYFLACQCLPSADLIAEPVGNDARVPATIHALDCISPDVLRVRLVCRAPFEFRPGQYLTLVRDNGLARAYSIASLPEEGIVELHVRRIPGGRMSQWLAEEARPGAAVSLQGPSGECFYVPGRESGHMLLIGTGTGLAPLYGIVRDALRTGHTGPIHLIHGAVRAAGLYLREELMAMARGHSNLTYTPSVLEGGAPVDAEVGPIDSLVAGRFPRLAGWRGFVCGDPALVRSIKKRLFLSGMAMRDIYSDAFLPSAPAVAGPVL